VTDLLGSIEGLSYCPRTVMGLRRSLGVASMHFEMG
jgi:hypothetical protein